MRGFVRAGSASDAAYDNARAFLTAQTSEKWNPDRTLVLLADDVAPKATLLDPATVRITARAAGTVDPEGRYTAARTGSTVTATFGLSTVGGEWRISELPDSFGRWIASSEVSRLVQPYDVHYVSTSQRALVPDTRWFPVDKLATRLARAQLVPVPAHLADASVTAVPVGSRLLGDAVSIDSGVATVNLLSNTKLSAGETTRQNLWAQFVSTLTQDTGVSRIVLSVNGVPVNIGGLDGSAGTLAEVGFTTPARPRAGATGRAPRRRRGRVRPGHARRRRAPPARGVRQLPAGAAHLPPARAVGRRRRGRRGRPRRQRHLAVARHQPLRGAARRHRPSATPRTTGAGSSGWAEWVPRAPRRRGSGSST